jgi:hypothetical protein
MRDNSVVVVQAIKPCQKDTDQDVADSQSSDVPIMAESKSSGRQANRVYLINSVCVPGRKGIVVEARVKSNDGDHGSFLFEPDQDQLSEEGLMSFDTLSNRGNSVLFPLENHLSVAVDLDSGCCLGTVTFVSEELGDAAISLEETTEPPVEVNQLTATERGDLAVDALVLEQGSLTKYQFHQLEDLIRHNSDVFALDASELGHTTIVEHHVDTGDHSPVKQQFRRIPFVHRQPIEKMVRVMREQGVIQPSTSPWASPLCWYQRKMGQNVSVWTIADSTVSRRRMCTPYLR